MNIKIHLHDKKKMIHNQIEFIISLIYFTS